MAKGQRLLFFHFVGVNQFFLFVSLDKKSNWLAMLFCPRLITSLECVVHTAFSFLGMEPWTKTNTYLVFLFCSCSDNGWDREQSGPAGSWSWIGDCLSEYWLQAPSAHHLVLRRSKARGRRFNRVGKSLSMLLSIEDHSKFNLLLSKKASSDGNATVSILRLRPKMDHIGQSLVCKATNPLITQSDLFDNMDLNIDCKWPQSSLMPLLP